jgi:hypothetical protein
VTNLAAVLRSSSGILGLATRSHGVELNHGFGSLGVEASHAYILSVSWTVFAASMIHVWTKDLNSTLWLLSFGFVRSRLLGVETVVDEFGRLATSVQELVKVLHCPAMDGMISTDVKGDAMVRTEDGLNRLRHVVNAPVHCCFV